MAGILYCEIHGRAGLLPLCEHLRQNVLQDVKPDKIITATYYFGDFFGEPNCPMIMGFLYCLDCAEKYGLPRESCASPGDEMESAPSEIIKAVCDKCFDEFLDKHRIIWDGFEIPSDDN
jgi:hypothetical protein